MKQVEILGIPITKIDHRTLVERLTVHIENGEKSFVITANPEIVMRAQRDPVYLKHIRAATYITADGIGIVKASHLFHNPLPERVTGYDLMLDFLQISQTRHYKVYLLGSQQEILDKSIQNIKNHYPELQIAGSHHGYFEWTAGDEDNPVVKDIRRTQPDIVFVALGAPKQEQWIAENWGHFTKGVFICVGGSLDVLAGATKRAPLSWQQYNVEWLYRLFQRPSRWKRMLSLPRFAYYVIKKKVERRP